MKNKIILFLAVISMAVFGGYILNDTVNKEIDPNSISGISQLAGVKGISNRIIAEDVLIEAMETNAKLVVMEVGAREKIYYDDSYFNSEIFRKSQEISFYADGVFTVSLEGLGPDSILIDDGNKTVAITIARPELSYIAYDPEKILYGNTEKGLLRFGDVKISMEEFNQLQIRAEELLKAKINGNDFIREAEKRTEAAAKELFKAALSKTELSEYEIIIILKGEESDLA